MNNLFIITEIKILEGNSPGAARVLNLAKALAAEGVDVYLCSFSPFHSISRQNIFMICDHVYLVSDKNESHSILRYYLMKFCMPIFVFLWLLKILKIKESIVGNIVFYIYPQPNISIDIVSLLLLKAVRRYQVFYDMNELRISNLFNKTFSENIFRRLFELSVYPFHYLKFTLVDMLTKYYDGLIVISTTLESYCKQYNKNLLRIPILSDTGCGLPAPPPDYQPNGVFKIGFSGSITFKKEGFDCLYKALSIVKSDINNFELHLYGPIHEKEKLLDKLPSSLGIKQNIIYHGIIKQDLLIPELRKNHLLVLPRPLNLQTHYGFSTKLSEYLVSGIPVLVTSVSDNALYIKDGYNGFVVQPGDYEKMSKKILSIVKQYQDIKDSIGKNAFVTAQQYFHYAVHSKKLHRFLFAAAQQ